MTSIVSQFKSLWENACFPTVQVINAERGKFREFKTHMTKELSHVTKEIALLHGKCKPSCAPPVITGEALCSQPPVFGTSDFVTTSIDDVYDITIPANPDSVLLSQNRNSGSVTGNKILLTPTGFTLGKVGDPPADYKITFYVNLLRTILTEAETFELVVFASLNNTGGIDDTATLGRSASILVSPNISSVGERTFLLTNVVGGTTVSLRAVNTVEDSTPVTLSVLQWSIVAELLQNGVKPFCKKPCPTQCRKK